MMTPSMVLSLSRKALQKSQKTGVANRFQLGLG